MLEVDLRQAQPKEVLCLAGVAGSGRREGGPGLAEVTAEVMPHLHQWGPGLRSDRPGAHPRWWQASCASWPPRAWGCPEDWRPGAGCPLPSSQAITGVPAVRSV